jgi:branched-chain amino acid transport system ATP-binding protein
LPDIRSTWRRARPADLSSAAPALRVEHLSVSYSGFMAVSQLDLEVPNGARHGLIGPNGAGKTTSFNAICGYVKPSAGRIVVHGKRVRRNSPRAAWSAGIGRTFQRAQLFWTLSVADHVELARWHALKRGLNPPSVEELFGLLRLGEFRDQSVAALSVGNCRLLELARAIATGASLILMDEPCSGLDHRETDELEVALRTIQQDLGLTLLIVEHDVEFILSIAERIHVLSSGELIFSGSPDETRRSSAVRAAYLGTDDVEPEMPHVDTATSPLVPDQVPLGSSRGH